MPSQTEPERPAVELRRGASIERRFTYKPRAGTLGKRLEVSRVGRTRVSADDEMRCQAGVRARPERGIDRDQQRAAAQCLEIVECVIEGWTSSCDDRWETTINASECANVVTGRHRGRVADHVRQIAGSKFSSRNGVGFDPELDPLEHLHRGERPLPVLGDCRVQQHFQRVGGFREYTPRLIGAGIVGAHQVGHASALAPSGPVAALQKRIGGRTIRLQHEHARLGRTLLQHVEQMTIGRANRHDQRRDRGATERRVQPLGGLGGRLHADRGRGIDRDPVAADSRVERELILRDISRAVFWAVSLGS